VVESNH